MKQDENTEQMSVSSPEISVIIPFYGDKNYLKKCLTGLKSQVNNIPFEVIIVASGNDAEVKQLADSLENSTLITSASQLYPGKARNIGIRNSKGKFLAFIDSDCVPESNWISQIYLSLKGENKIVIGPVINLYPFHPVASVDNLLQFSDFQKYRPSENISHFPACNLGMTRELCIKAGEFPEDIITGEDVKFSESAINNCEGKILYNKRLIVKHSGRKNFKGLIEHNKTLGYYRGFLNLKISSGKNESRRTLMYSLIFGIKRLIYLSVRTAQWNPVGLLRIIFFLPIFITGLAAWTAGFFRGNQKYLEKQT